MLRYIALVWNPDDAAQEALALGTERRARSARDAWQLAYEHRGVRVLCKDERPAGARIHRLQERQGVLLGGIFVKDAPASYRITPAELSAGASSKIIQSDGRELIRSYWGSYVAILHDPNRATTWVLRGPCASLPCFAMTVGKVNVFFSYLPDCVALGLGGFSIDWSYVAKYLVKFPSVSATGLNEVSEIRGGYCSEVRPEGATRRQYWDPREIAALDPILAEATAIDAMRATTRACVHAWSALHGSVLLSLSGGIDSSIVLSCLASSPAKTITTCLNRRCDDPNGDERAFARLAAARARCELVELFHEPRIDFREALRAELSEAPWRYMSWLSLDEVESGLARQKQATAIFSGHGGDEIFLRSSRYAASDYALAHGFDRRFIAALFSRSEQEEISIWRACRDALYEGLFVDSLSGVKAADPKRMLITEDVIKEARRDSAVTQSWYGPEHRVPLGKQQQIRNLLNPGPSYYWTQPAADDPERVAPLLSQPIIEVCLRIPTYVLVQRGLDRVIARRAFANDMPPEIVNRRSKGRISRYTARVVRDNMAFMRELLLDGQLVQHRLLDRTKLELALADRPSSTARGTATLFRYLNAEIWLALWTHKRMRLAA